MVKPEHTFILYDQRIKDNAVACVASLTLDDNLYRVEIHRHVEKHSTDQQKGFHWLLGEWSAECGTDPDMLKDCVKRAVYGTTTVEKMGFTFEILNSSARMNKIEYTRLIEGAYRLAAEYGYVLPQLDKWR